MGIKTIKNVDEKTWRELKMLSAEHNIPLGKLLEKITDDYKARSKEFWDKILHGEKILSDKEAKELKSVVAALRKEHGFR